MCVYVTLLDEINGISIFIVAFCGYKTSVFLFILEFYLKWIDDLGRPCFFSSILSSLSLSDTCRNV